MSDGEETEHELWITYENNVVDSHLIPGPSP